MENFMDPQNMGEIPDADGIGKVGNPKCGDLMWVSIKVDKNDNGEEVISDIKVKTFGCAAAIATSSMITELAKGKTLEQAKKITNKDVAKSLGDLPQLKMHCSNLAADALKKAIGGYEGKKKRD